MNYKTKQKRRNLTYKKRLTKYQQAKQNKRILAIMAFVIPFTLTQAFFGATNIEIRDFMDTPDVPVILADSGSRVGDVANIKANTSPAELPMDWSTLSYEEKIIPSEIREITMYNVGDPNQCDDTPCISASGDNICSLVARGIRVCAANFVPLGTKLEIQNYGECVVLDRMNSRFKNRVDIAVEAHEKERAVKFGLQHLAVKVLDN